LIKVFREGPARLGEEKEGKEKEWLPDEKKEGKRRKELYLHTREV